MRLLLDLFLDRVGQFVVDFAAVPEVLLDFLLVIHLDLFAIVVLLVPLVSEGIDLALLELFAVFVWLRNLLLFTLCLLLDSLYFAFVLLQEDLASKLLQEFVGLV